MIAAASQIYQTKKRKENTTSFRRFVKVDLGFPNIPNQNATGGEELQGQ